MVNGMTEEEVVIKYEALVYKLARKQYIKKKDLMDRDMSFEDLVQLGYIGLLDAYRTFEEGKGANFMTYAYTCIPNRIVRDGFRPRRVKTMMALDSGVSLDAPVKTDKGEDTSYGDLLAGEDDFNIESTVYEDIRVKLYNKLSSDERKILTLYNLEGKTQDEIGQIYGVSKTRIGHIISDITNRLKVQYMRECRNA